MTSPNYLPVDPRRSAEAEVDYSVIFQHGPTVVGRYQLGRRLGRGRLGPCYEAWHLERQREAVVKLLTIDAGGAARIDREEELIANLSRLATLRHPTLVPLVEVGRTSDGLYLALEAAPGRLLETVLSAGWRPDGGAGRVIVRDLVEALAHAHSKGFVHGDLHAGQVMLDLRGRPRLLDLGLRLAAGPFIRTEPTDSRLGDRAAVAPEVRTGSPPGAAADVYALAVLVLRLLVDESRFVSAAHASLAGDGSWPALRSLWPAAPADLDEWLSRALSIDPAVRPSLGEGLPASMQVPPAAPAPPSPPEVDAPTHGVRPRVWWVVATTVGILLAVALAAVLLKPAPEPADLPPSNEQPVTTR